jgi:hypothetical protein
MKTIRNVAGILSVFPILLIIDSGLRPYIYSADDSFLALTFYAVGGPILVLNYWAWFAPHLLEHLFFGRKHAVI